VKFSSRYLLIELLMGLAAVGAFWVAFHVDIRTVAVSDEGYAIVQSVPWGVRFARFAVYFAFLGVLLVLSGIDWDTKQLPDKITLPSIVIFYLAGFGIDGPSWSDRAIGAGAGYLAVRLISDGYYYLRGREGLGYGDGKLLALIGALLGWQALPYVVFGASMLGVVTTIPVLWLRRRRQPESDPARDAQAIETEADSGAASESAGKPIAAADMPSTLGPNVSESDVSPADVGLGQIEVPFGPFLAVSAAILVLFGARFAAWLGFS
jgi:leader peptidase (prepilin peptidase)/N-methyltransferase